MYVSLVSVFNFHVVTTLFMCLLAWLGFRKTSCFGLSFCQVFLSPQKQVWKLACLQVCNSVTIYSTARYETKVIIMQCERAVTRFVKMSI